MKKYYVEVKIRDHYSVVNECTNLLHAKSLAKQLNRETNNAYRVTDNKNTLAYFNVPGQAAFK